MIGFFLMNVVLYVIYRSDSYFSMFLALSLTLIVLLLSVSLNEPIFATSSAVFLPFLIFL